MVYIKDIYQCSQMKWSSDNDLECIGVTVTLSPQMSFVLVAFYRPPSSNIGFYEPLKILLKECDSMKWVKLMGDFINREDKINRKALKQTTDHFDQFTGLPE